MTDKPRVRVKAYSNSPKSWEVRTQDSFQNFRAKVGWGTDNIASGSTYGFNPVTRLRTMLEWMYRGSWIVGNVVDVIAEDMTRAGFEVTGKMDPVKSDELQKGFHDLALWEKISDGIKWGRLYGGCIGVLLIDGQRPDTPLNIESVGKDQFKGLLILDRWMVQPSLNDIVKDIGSDPDDLGLPAYYDTVVDAPAIPRMKVHHSRCIRFGGHKLPYWQAISENLWDMSVIERLFDRLIAFDSTTQGAAQLVYKAYLRTIKIKDLRSTIATGGAAMDGLVQQLNMIRQWQSNEGLTVIDAEDDFQASSYAFSGLDSVLLQFGQQLSGATQIPLVRLFGQSPAGLNSTGESDIITYYDGINQRQVRQLSRPMIKLCKVLMRSRGIAEPSDFGLEFNPLWQLADDKKADVAEKVSRTVGQALQDRLIGPKTAMQELKQSSRITGIFSNISGEQIEAADEDPPDPIEQMQEMQEAGLGGPPGPDDDEGDTPTKPGAKKPTKDDNGRLPMREVQGMQMVIETFKGTARTGAGWSVILSADYGFFQATGSSEGPMEQLDCFIGTDDAADKVYVVEQRNLKTGAFDEYKCMVAFPDQLAATKSYCENYNDGKGFERVMSVTPMTVDEFKVWMFTDATTKPMPTKRPVLRAVR